MARHAGGLISLSTGRGSGIPPSSGSEWPRTGARPMPRRLVGEGRGAWPGPPPASVFRDRLRDAPAPRCAAWPAVPVGQQEVASPGRLAPDRRHHSRRQIQGRRKANRTRRLKPASPTFDNSSPLRHAQAVSHGGMNQAKWPPPNQAQLMMTDTLSV